MVELALVLPVLLAILIGVVQFALVYHAVIIRIGPVKQLHKYYFS